MLGKVCSVNQASLNLVSLFVGVWHGPLLVGSEGDSHEDFASYTSGHKESGTSKRNEFSHLIQRGNCFPHGADVRKTASASR